MRRPARRGAPSTDGIRPGIQAVYSLLASGRWTCVEGAAPELEKELLGHGWDEKTPEHGKDRPLKENDHGADALQYG